MSGAEWLLGSDSGVGRADNLENMYMNCVMLCFCLTCARCQKRIAMKYAMEATVVTCHGRTTVILVLKGWA